MSPTFEATFWGFFSGGALVLGAAVGYYARVPGSVVAGVMAFGSTGYDLLPNISPTFEWIRLAQRVPVRIHLDKIPEGVQLRVGTTASVVVMTGTSGSKNDKPAVAAPKALQ